MLATKLRKRLENGNPQEPQKTPCEIHVYKTRLKGTRVSFVEWAPCRIYQEEGSVVGIKILDDQPERAKQCFCSTRKIKRMHMQCSTVGMFVLARVYRFPAGRKRVEDLKFNRNICTKLARCGCWGAASESSLLSPFFTSLEREAVRLQAGRVHSQGFGRFPAPVNCGTGWLRQSFRRSSHPSLKDQTPCIAT